MYLADTDGDIFVEVNDLDTDLAVNRDSVVISLCRASGNDTDAVPY